MGLRKRLADSLFCLEEHLVFYSLLSQDRVEVTDSLAREVSRQYVQDVRGIRISLKGIGEGDINKKKKF